MSQIGMAYNPYQTYDPRSFQPTDRFYVRASVFLPDGDVDPATGMLKKDARRRGRTQAMRMEAHRLDTEYAEMDKALKARRKEKGILGYKIPIRYGFLLFFVFIFIFSTVLLAQQGTLALRLKNLEQMTQRLDILRNENADLQAQIDEASDASTICYTAARDLDMVPASSTQAIHLTAVDTRPDGGNNYISASADAQAVGIAGANTGE